MPSVFVAALPIAFVLAAVLFALLRSRRKTRSRRPLREPSAFVVLEGNAWDACVVDDLREPWSKLTTEPIRGFCGVPPGRHRVVTTTDAGEACLDFVVYPGEVLAWRLDPDRARWEPHDLEGETRAALEGTPASTLNLELASRPKLPGWLVHLRTTMNMVGARAGAPPRAASSEGDTRIRKRLAKLVARVETEPSTTWSEDAAEARALGDAIVGRPMSRREMRLLAEAPRAAALRLASRGDTERAKHVLSLGLAVLPGDPELMVVAGCVLAEHGETDEALRALSAALERDRCLDAEDIARAMRARLDLRSPLGRRVRV